MFVDLDLFLTSISKLVMAQPPGVFGVSKLANLAGWNGTCPNLYAGF